MKNSSNSTAKMAIDVQGWLWKLDCIQKEMQRLLMDVNLLFSLKFFWPGGGGYEFETFPWGMPLDCGTRNVPALQDPKTGEFWFDLGYGQLPSVVCLEDMSLHDSMPSAFFSKGEPAASSFKSACWCSWHYLKANDGEEVMTKERSDRFLHSGGELYESLLGVCHLAPEALLDKVGDLSILGSWPTALFYLAMKRIHPLFRLWVVTARSDPVLPDPPSLSDSTFSHLNDVVIQLDPCDVVTATGYALDTFRHFVEGTGLPARPPDEASGKPRWDRDKSRLLLDGRVIRKVRGRTVAKNVVKVFEAFEEEGWPDRIDDPLDPSKDQKRLHETVKRLNDNLDVIRFRADGTGQGFVWERIPPP